MNMKTSIILLSLRFLRNFNVVFPQSSYDCANFMGEWTPQNCAASVGPSQRRYCKLNQAQVVTMSPGDLVDISCQDVRPDVNIFQCLNISSVEFLHIKDCNLSDFDIGSMVHNSELKKIEITSSNKTGRVSQPVTFRRMETLESVTFVGYVDLAPRVHLLFTSVPKLRNLSVVDHQMIVFPANSIPFLRIESLKHLGYRKGFLRSIENGTFDELTTLVSLDLSYNYLRIINEQTFGKLRNLRNLDLTSNEIQYISNCLLPLRALESVKFSYNIGIRLAPTLPFGPSRSLSVVEIDHCNLTEFPNIDWTIDSLKLINISYNRIRYLDLPPKTAANTTVDLRHSSIEIITLKNLSNSLTSSPSYLIANNTLKCVCTASRFFRHIYKVQRNPFVDIMEERCSDYPSTKLLEAWFRRLNRSIKTCPRNCQCLDALGDRVVDCNGKGLSLVPLHLPNKTTKILLSNNLLSSLSPFNDDLWKSVKHLELNGNRIKSLPSDLMKQVDSSRNYKLLLANNNWQCECQFISLLNWFRRNKNKILDIDNTFCTVVAANGTRTSPVLKVNIQQLSCNKDSLSSHKTISVSIIISLFFILLAFACYCNRDTLKLLGYCCKCHRAWQDSRGRLKPFDAFVVYHPSDRPKIDVLIKNLEPSLHLCLHEREWLPDLEIAHHMSISFQTSRKTLVLVSRSFMNSVWFQDFSKVYTREMKPLRDNIMLISIDEIDDTEDLNPDLQFLFTDRMQLTWGERLFWPKLRYFLYSTDKK